MKKIMLLGVLISILSCKSRLEKQTVSRIDVDQTLNAWHKAAIESNYTAYFDLMAQDAVFLGTEATENWNKNDFETYAKPYFDKGKAWKFMVLERDVFFDGSGKIAWFNELLNTEMKICRGSGVVIKIGKNWKIKQYVLSMTVPNDCSAEVIKIKEPLETLLIQKLLNKKE